MSIASLNEGSVVTQDPGAGAVTVINAVTPHATLNVHIGILVQIDRTDTTSETMFTFVTTIGTFVRTFKLVSEGSTKFFYENDHFVEAGETVTLTVASNDTDDDDVDFQYYIYDMSQTALETVVDTLKWAEGIVYVNDDTGTNSTVYPYGTVDAPTDTIATAKIIADANNLKSINVHGNHTLAAAMEYYNFFSDWHMDINHTLNLGGQDVDHSTFTKITLVGVNGGGGGFGDQIRCAYCLILGLTDFNGVLTKGFMSGFCSIVDGGYFAAIDTFFGYLVNCTLTLQSPGECNIVNMRGAVAFAGMDG